MRKIKSPKAEILGRILNSSTQTEPNWAVEKSSKLNGLQNYFQMPISGKNKMQIIKPIKKNSLRNIGEEDRIIEESSPALLPPTTIVAYNKLVSGAAEDLLREYIEDRKQRRKIEMMEAKDRQHGRYFAMTITILCVVAAILIGIYSGHWIKVSLLLISVLPVIIYRFQNPSAEHLTLAQSIKRRLSNPAARKE